MRGGTTASDIPLIRPFGAPSPARGEGSFGLCAIQLQAVLSSSTADSQSFQDQRQPTPHGVAPEAAAEG